MAGGGGSNGGPGGNAAGGPGGGEPASTASAAHPSHGGGSSPLVPILIAVAVLAALSIGVVLYRQRKSAHGESDGRVSSSSAG